MSSGKKPSLSVSPRAVTADVASKLSDLQVAEEWAQAPVLEDVANAGLKPTESTQVESEGVGEGDSPEPALGHVVRALRPKRERKQVTHLLRLDPETNERIENLIDNIPRSSKHGIIILALKEYLTRVERAIEKRKAG